MMELVFFLEEPSAKAMLEGVLPRLLPDQVAVRYVVFDGKSDLEKRLPIRLRAWQNPNARFLVLRDQDIGDCRVIKARIQKLCADAGKPETLVRIACHELESFYLGDLAAVGQAIGPKNLARQQSKSAYRDPDRLNSAAHELKRLAPTYQKLAGSRAIGPLMDLNANCSVSFNQLLSGIRKIIGNAALI